MSDDAPRRDRKVAVFLWLLPLWLAVSAAAGIWFYFHREAVAADVDPIRFATPVSEKNLRDDVGKFLNFVGERHRASEAGARGLNRAASMIEGSLGPGNAGYRVEHVLAPATARGRWPILIARLRGSDDSAPPLWVVAGYDARPGSAGAELNATGVASTMAVANALAGTTPRRTVMFAFLPHAYDPDAPLPEVTELLRERAAAADAVLVVESTGSNPALTGSSRDAGSRVLARVAGLADVTAAETVGMGTGSDLSSMLSEAGLPAVRVASRPVVAADEYDSAAPDPEIHAAATQALQSLVSRLADS